MAAVKAGFHGENSYKKTWLLIFYMYTMQYSVVVGRVCVRFCLRCRKKKQGPDFGLLTGAAGFKREEGGVVVCVRNIGQSPRPSQTGVWIGPWHCLFRHLLKHQRVLLCMRYQSLVNAEWV
ncbi:hypothetical protein AVEN_220208-1 [Araneus ventricosus]|uniref:Uncharacterized protein n=1 Tax=Araneus ventricosus TaxID=182803 RepID=A0A4Y2H1U7_ARAVE|nr:hypothetical protein AVEN_220208-1 [Araneus ventricosus]